MKLFDESIQQFSHNAKTWSFGENERFFLVN